MTRARLKMHLMAQEMALKAARIPFDEVTRQV